MTRPPLPGDCDGCPLPHGRAAERQSRREFLRQAGILLGAMGAVALRVDEAMALPMDGTEAPAERRYPIPPSDGVAVDRENGVIIARVAGRAYAFSLACPHQNTALRWEAADGEFRCPKHKSRYRPEGTFIDGRATRAMDRLPIRREGDVLVVDVDTLYQQDERPKEWAAAWVAV